MGSDGGAQSVAIEDEDYLLPSQQTSQVTSVGRKTVVTDVSGCYDVSGVVVKACTGRKKVGGKVGGGPDAVETGSRGGGSMIWSRMRLLR